MKDAHFSHLTTEKTGSVLRITMTDAARLNALSTGMIEALHQTLQAASEDRSIKAIILAAEGKAFSAGHDLKEIREARAADDGGRVLAVHAKLPRGQPDLPILVGIEPGHKSCS